MTLNLDNAGTIVALLVGLVTITGGLFWMLRYIIRAETAELRTNGGSTMKDTVHRIDERSAETRRKAAAIEKKLDEHMTEATERIQQGDRDKTAIDKRQAAIDARQDAQDQIIATLAEAVSVAARSTPPPEEQHQ